jgi:branched-chain amino acid transport system permease protein
VTYLASLLPLAAIYGILVLGLNLQYGLTGILNFTYITFVAMGAYVGGVLTIGPPAPGSLMTYILGAHVPFPLNLLAGGLAAALVGALVSVAALRRLRSDYLAIVTVAAGQIIYTIVGNENNFFNGWDGIFGIPVPTPPGLTGAAQQLFFGGVALLCLAVVFVGVEAIRRSPLGRTLRAIREDEDVSEAFGRNTFGLKFLVFLLGCFVAGVGGALLSEYATAFNPSAMLPNETFILWAALLVGGTANNWGALLGALIVPVGFAEATRFLPEIGSATLVESLRGVAIGLLIILVLWFLPRGIIPERLPVDRAGGRRRPAVDEGAPLEASGDD